MADHPIEQAYEAYRDTPFGESTQSEIDKLINTTKALAQAPTHLDRTRLSFREFQRRAVQLIPERHIHPYLKQIREWDDLASWLTVLATFLKAGPDKDRKGKEEAMRTFQLADNRREWSSKKISKKAQKLSAKLSENEDANKNKLKRLGAQINLARDPWEALAALARFYPRQNVPKKYVDELVKHLGQTDLRSFKRLVAQSLIFYEADQIKAEQ
jgi:hypothetical protein